MILVWLVLVVRPRPGPGPIPPHRRVVSARSGAQAANALTAFALWLGGRWSPSQTSSRAGSRGAPAHRDSYFTHLHSRVQLHKRGSCPIALSCELATDEEGREIARESCKSDNLFSIAVPTDSAREQRAIEADPPPRTPLPPRPKSSPGPARVATSALIAGHLKSRLALMSNSIRWH